MQLVKFCDDASELESSFINLSNQLSDLLKNEGIHKVAYAPGLPLFRALSLERKTRLLSHLQSYNTLCVEHQIDRHSLRDSKTFTWRAMMKFGLTPDSELMDKITNEDVVEIYSEDHTQLFRNFEFFGISSYTLEQLFCLEWWSLFERDDAHSVQILSLVNQMFAGRAPLGFSRVVPAHIVTEKCSEGRFRVNYEMQHFAPLYRNKRVEAIISIVRGTALD
ncbi:MAG: hypothetical protein EOP09_04715 [Proteobacteria bacterium]|nr:MAG: hypothetical protein EOP09_04715 [Pseudomonadota bacterium]